MRAGIRASHLQHQYSLLHDPSQTNQTAGPDYIETEGQESLFTDLHLFPKGSNSDM